MSADGEVSLSNGLDLKLARRFIASLTMIVALFCGLTPASANDAPSSIKDRARFISITRQLEQDPLNPDLIADRGWAMNWLNEAPDIAVVVCANTLSGLLQSDYQHKTQIIAQYVFAIGARVIENPETADDPIAQQMAGVNGALAAYRSILRDEPDATSPALEEMVQVQDQGEMPNFVREAYTRCG